jgi:hypothetical protein
MPPAESHLLTRIKLRELQRQRDRLNDHYAAVEQKAARAKSELERLRVLYDGLRAARFAQSSLHPDVANLDVLLFEAEVGTAPPGLVESWVRRLRQELAQGRLRAEFAYVFGRLLDEWANPDAAAGPEGGEPPRPGEEPWAGLWDETPVALDLSPLDDLFERNRPSFDAVRAAVRTYGEQGVFSPVQDEEVRALLGALARDIYRQAALRRQAVATLSSDTQVHEYTGVLTILLSNLDEWDWPAEGIELRPLWTRNKWRPYLDEDVLTVLFLQLVGLRWGMRLKSLARSGSQVGPGLFRVDETWPPHVQEIERRRLEQAASLFLPHVPDNLRQWAKPGGGYGGGGYGGPAGGGREAHDSLEKLLAMLVGEIQFHRAALPDEPLFVAQTDLRDFYPTVPHALLTALFDRLGFPPAWKSFFGRYLQVRLKGPQGLRTVRRGLLLGHTLGAVFAELLLWLLDVHVYQGSGVRLFRVVDDIYFSAPTHERALEAWRAVQGFCAACGLQTNAAKSGSVCLFGAADTEGLPDGLPRWGLLRLQPDTTWAIDEPALDRLQERIRQEVGAVPAVLGMVARTNDYLSYLLRNLGVRVALDRGHLERVGRRLARLFQGLFGPGHGVPDEVHRRVNERFLDARLRERGLPEALLYWPITAGGLGLTDPFAQLTAYEKARGLLAEPAVPVQRFDKRAAVSWGYYYNALARLLGPAKPDDTPAMQRLVNDFIARGTKVSGRKQAGLSPYWQWALYTYGPQLLEALGTFRFLLTELVPLQLIYHNRIGGSSLGGEAAASGTVDAGAEDIPF